MTEEKYAGGRARARLFGADGSVADITEDEKLHGLQEFFDTWQRDAEIPQELRSSCWQFADDEHPAGGGIPAYRIVYKTLRWVPYPDIEMNWPNLRLTFKNGPVTTGNLQVARLIAGRSPRHGVLPEFGKLLHDDRRAMYLPCVDLEIGISSKIKTLEAVSHVEILWHAEDVDVQDYEAVVARARRAIGPLKTLLDLKFGPRLLAMPLTEEVGEIFSDGHWNRRDYSGLFTIESQASIRQLKVSDVTEELSSLLEAEQKLSAAERKRLGLASLWYWRADAEPDRVVRYISWWVVVESLEMKTPDPSPVRRRLGKIFGNDQGYWGKLVGTLWRLRGELVHGESADVPDVSLRSVEVLARTLLTKRLLGQVPVELQEEMHVTAKRLNSSK